MFKFMCANLLLLSMLPLSAAAANSICAGYNDYVFKQCVSAEVLKDDLSAEMLQGYSIDGCRDEAFKMILESDSSANASCKPVKSGERINSLE